MDGHGLYLPKIFKDQKYSDEYNIPFKELKDKKTLILQPAVLMAAAVNETSGKVLVLNAETD